MSASIRAVERALDVLMCFTNATPSLTMTQISDMVGLNKSTVHRLLATLEAKRFLERDAPTGIYKPGIRLVQMAFLSRGLNPLRSVSTPFLEDLSGRIRENVNLAVLAGADVIYLSVIESPQRVKLAAVPGQRLPAFCTASGKAMLAFLPEESVTAILERGMPRYTANTITSPAALLDDLARVRERGLAMSTEEFEDGINAIAAPVSEPPLASVSIAGPAYRLTPDRMLQMAPALLETARLITAELERARDPA